MLAPSATKFSPSCPSSASFLPTTCIAFEIVGLDRVSVSKRSSIVSSIVFPIARNIRRRILSRNEAFLKQGNDQVFNFLRMNNNCSRASEIMSHRIDVSLCSFLRSNVSPTSKKKKKERKKDRKKKRRIEKSQRNDTQLARSSLPVVTEKFSYQPPGRHLEGSSPRLRSVCLSNGTEPKSLEDFTRAESLFAREFTVGTPRRPTFFLPPSRLRSLSAPTPRPLDMKVENKEEKKVEEEEEEREGNRRNRRPLFRALPRFGSTRSNYRLYIPALSLLPTPPPSSLTTWLKPHILFLLFLCRFD